MLMIHIIQLLIITYLYMLLYVYVYCVFTKHIITEYTLKDIFFLFIYF